MQVCQIDSGIKIQSIMKKLQLRRLKGINFFLEFFLHRIFRSSKTAFVLTTTERSERSVLPKSIMSLAQTMKNHNNQNQNNESKK